MRTIPVTKPYFTDDEQAAVVSVLGSGWVAQGPRVAEFEKLVAKHEEIAQGVAVTSCTAALHLAMTAQGMGAGMDVIAPAFTFVATVNAITATGATPVLADIDKNTFNMDISQVQKIIEMQYRREGGKLVNTSTGNVLWGIVTVHQFGLCCQIQELNQIAEKNGLLIIEDAACALGAKIGERHQGTFGNCSCISFHPRKSITTGEGGMVLTDDHELAERLRRLRSHGNTIPADSRDKNGGFLLPEFHEAGYNYRMTDLQGAIGIVQMQKLDSILEEKRKRAALYHELIAAKLHEFIVPLEPDGYYHTYQSYVCMLDLDKIGLAADIEAGGSYRNRLLEKLQERGVATRQGTHAVHLLGYYKNKYGYRPEDYSQAYACDRLSITLPLYFGMTDDDQEYVVDCIREIIDSFM